MALIRVKICGITTKAEVDAVNRCRPDYMGFVFADSRRRVTYEEAANLKRQLSSGIKAVGVFVNEPIDYILKLVQERVVDLIQLHGEEDESYLRLLRQKTACPIMRAVRVRNTKQILEASGLSCDILLLDSFHKDTFGGSGECFDHSLIPPLQKPFFLAGGLNVGNLGHCIARCKPYGIDVSSGAETNGRKDEEKIRQIIEIVTRRTKISGES